MDPKSREVQHLLNMIRNLSSDRHCLNQLSVLIVPLLNLGMHFVKTKEFIKVHTIEPKEEN